MIITWRDKTGVGKIENISQITINKSGDILIIYELDGITRQSKMSKKIGYDSITISNITKTIRI